MRAGIGSQVSTQAFQAVDSVASLAPPHMIPQHVLLNNIKQSSSVNVWLDLASVNWNTVLLMQIKDL